jgi:hypothetical protein
MVKFQPSKLAMRVRFPLPAHLPMKLASKSEAEFKSQNVKSEIVQGKGDWQGHNYLGRQHPEKIMAFFDKHMMK